LHTPQNNLCQDGSWCNGAETCDVSLGRCKSGTAINCNDNIACTADTCYEGTAGDNLGECKHSTDTCSCFN